MEIEHREVYMNKLQSRIIAVAVVAGIIFVMLVFAKMNQGQISISHQTENTSKDEAVRLWDLAVAAKGGREKLYSIQNMVGSISSEYRFEGSKIKSRTEQFVVFPNKEWSWDDDRPSVFGLRMTMYDWEKQKQYNVLFRGEPFHGLVAMEKNVVDLGKMSWVANIFLETKYHKPVPQSVSKGKVDSKRVDIVQTILGDERIDFALDEMTHLPVKFTHYIHNLGTKPGDLFYEGFLTDYIDVQGIKMPRGSGKGNGKKTVFQFNVEYNEEIFRTPPRFEVGPEAWKKR